MSHASEPVLEPAAQRAALSGVQRIEASAGAGKTWTLCALYLRLVVEQGAAVDRIVAITYTIAAAAELRGRIRERLRQMLDALDGRLPPDDTFIPWLLARIADRVVARARVLAALHGFDEARVHTIHGFCQRALVEHAFGSGASFDCELDPDPTGILHEVAADFWRRRIAGAAGAGAGQALLVQWLGSKADLVQLEKWALPWARRERRDLRLLRPQAAPVDEALDALEAARSALCARWPAECAALVAELGRHDFGAAYKAKYVNSWCESVTADLAGSSGLELPNNLARFGSSMLGKYSKAPAPPRHVLIEAVDALFAARDAAEHALRAHWVQLRLDFLDYAREEIGRRLAQRGIQNFDDLLIKLDRALAAPGGERLAAALRERCPHALIDEFQDTDPMQWRVFRTLWGGADAPGALMLVGDPKQAIYGFRGADVYAYLAAAESTGAALPLGENQRSVRGYVEALNTLFLGHDDPFRHAAIHYGEVLPSPRAKPALAEQGEADRAPLRIAFLEGGGERALSKDNAAEAAAEQAAAEVARLLAAARAGSLRLGDRELRAGDIAVLVRTNPQGAQVRRALSRRGVACALMSTESVFASDEARQLERLLLAMAAPRDAMALRGALVTDFMGWTAPEAQARSEGPEWEAVLDAFGRCHALWRDRGVMRALAEALRQCGAHARLAAFADGERRLTNLHHLCELLNLQERRVHGMEALIAWLGARRLRIGTEDMQLRLESDHDLVRIATVHRAKGLEWPVTLVPFLWSGPQKKDKEDLLAWHEQEPPHVQVLDGRDAALNAERAWIEQHGEDLRVAYVALTRAKNRCYLWTGDVNQLERSPLGWLLHRLTQPRAAPEALRADVERLIEDSGGSIAWHEPGAAGATGPAVMPAPEAFAARPFDRALVESYAVSSFSSLLRGLDRGDADPLPDHDQAAPSVPAPRPEPGGTRFAFPRGAAAGTCLHAVLERVDFAAPAWGGVPAVQLRRAGYSASWAPDLETWLREVVTTPLQGPGPGADFRLSEVPVAAQRRELAFHLAAPDFTPRALTAIAQRHGVPMSELAAGRLPGYLGGFVDLAFVHDGRWYVADHKSNWLGATPESYAAPALEGVMADADYHLQALIYTVALHRWLGSWLRGYDYDRHFGGVRYLFLRGMHPQWRDAAGQPLGVHASRPTRALIEALDAALGAPRERAA